MREYNATVEKSLYKGLRQFPSQARNLDGGLVECFNVKPSPGGLIPYEPLAWPSNTMPDLHVHWPFPQIFQGSKYRIIASATTIYSLSGFTKTAKVTSITEAYNTCWDMADFHDMFLLTNGGTMIYLDHGTIAVQKNPPVWTKDTNGITEVPLAMSYENFKGQLICGGIKSTWYDCDESWLVWSNIGDWNCVPSKSNEAGFKQMDWEGEVLKVKRLGDAVIVYGYNGVTAAVPHEQTFGFKELLPLGIRFKGAVGGDKNRHVFVDGEQYLWEIGRDLQPNKLDYRDWMQELVPGRIMIVHNPVLDEYYIGDGNTSFLLTRSGLCQVFQCVTSIARFNNVTFGIFEEWL